MKKIFSIVALFFFCCFCSLLQFKPEPVSANQTENTDIIVQAEIIQVLDQGIEIINDFEAEYQLLTVQLKSDEISQPIQIKHGGIPTTNFETYKPGDRVFIQFFQPLSELDPQEVLDTYQANIVTRARDQAVLVIFVIFVAMVLLVNRFKGLRSLLSLALSFAVIFFIALPLLLRGIHPLLVTLSLVAFIIPVSFYLTHGFTKKTHVAVVGTVLSLFFSIILASFFISSTGITGTSSEEAGFLLVELQDQINLGSLFLAGIIIGLLGTLDDVTITQAGIVFTLKKNKPKISLKELFLQAFAIGQDHISSMVNTLILVYTGASLPLLLLFVNNPHPLAYVLSQEVIVEEVIRMMVSSTGLIFAAPVTTLLAVMVSKKQLEN
jgi:uncharacterized membrane protein